MINDASWTVKRGRPHYGYKIHGAVDLKNGFPLGAHATGANISDTTKLAKVISESALPRSTLIYKTQKYGLQASNYTVKKQKL